MTIKEIKDILHDYYLYRKSDLRTIKSVIEAIEKEGYVIVKNGVDDYSLEEKGFIKDFTKPIKVYENTPELADHIQYKGIPMAQLVDFFIYACDVPKLWCYLANNNENVIHFDKMIELEIAKNYDSLIYFLDCFTVEGILAEKEDHIAFYIYPMKIEGLKVGLRAVYDLPRFASAKFEK